jgi:ABC-type dipeptide/oligopeptide/nickel transport system permease component
VNLSDKSNPRSRKELMNTALISVTGSVGCLTVSIILGAVLGGMWLDGHYGTKPTWTISLALLSIPVSVVAMILVVRAIIKRIQPDLEKDQKKQSAEENRSSGS